MSTVSIRAYEQRSLPLSQRLASLCQRFESLDGVPGTSPFEPGVLMAYAENAGSQSDINEATRQAVRFVLGLARVSNHGFDLFEAMRHWSESDRAMCLSVMRIWDFTDQ